ncbi:MAG: hypothetical protein CFE43_03340 [Burkholderiales bacterium PBB3]|nr:MAG: hypothetical protein CFE43_03340 [Burkholderiales bacterium PBB3]
MHKSIFVPHGQFHIRTQGQVVISEIQGPWNLEMMSAWGKGIAPITQALSAKGPVGSIGIYSHSLLTSPESLDLLTKMLRFSVAHYRVVCTADVYDASVEGHMLGKRIFKSVYEGSVPNQSFATEQEAITWVNQCLAAVKA